VNSEPVSTRIAAQRAEREERMRLDPEFRARQEKNEAEARAREAREAQAKAAAARLAVEERRRRLGLPSFTHRHLEKPDDTEAVRIVRRLREVPELLWLILAGPPGVGKSIAGAVWLDGRETRRKFAPDTWSDDGQGVWTEIDLSSRFIAAMELPRHGLYGEDGKFWDGLKDVDRLVIDDLGTEPLDGKGYALANLGDLLSQRHAWQRKTLITTNLSLEAFRERYLAHDGGRLYDRLREAGLFYECSGASMRRPLEVSNA
jgi:DNA replication protein DnaC